MRDLSSASISLRTKSIHPKKVKIITLGCSKNIVDSEVLKSQLEANQFNVRHETAERTPVVIINTCGFIDLAKEESINTILEYAGEKKQGRLEKLYVTGCLSQRYKDDLEQEIPEVDAYFGTMELPSLLKTMGATYRDELLGERSIVTPAHYAYLKISEGCNRTCAFCAIPLMRGQHVSRTMESLVKEATHLANRGVKELILIAQELTYYGLDLYQRRALPELLDKLCEVEGIEWIRLHYAYPHKFPLEIIEVMKRQPKICNYLDMPLQHISDPVLKGMRRQITSEETKDLIRNIREIHPAIRIRTTFLVGFPGETQEDHEALCKFVEETKFDRVGVFEYSHEEGTRGYVLNDDVPAEVKKERAEEIMSVQQSNSMDHNASLIGSELKVLIDRREGGQYVGRTEYDSPEVDNEVWIESGDKKLMPGNFVVVNITGASDYDLTGVLVKEKK
ncbi:MAG TPA: 30S ribosomal protein S12 methylthiotransferase RimO [Saprospiraceae bacterium]|nr:30S ribosomal protein S12 methylthiotransferase RimO [Saprospiraceae bacterium]